MTNLTQTAPSAQSAAGLAEVIILPRHQRSCSSNAVQIVQAAIAGHLFERWKTAGEGSEKRTNETKKTKTET